MNRPPVFAQPPTNDYFSGPSTRTRSPLRGPMLNNQNTLNFAQLSRPTSRPGSSAKGLFKIEIEKSKRFKEANPNDNPYCLLTGSAQPVVSKSPSKLLSLKQPSSSMYRSKSPLRAPERLVAPPKENANYPLIIDSKSRISFSSLTKNKQAPLTFAKPNLKSNGSLKVTIQLRPCQNLPPNNYQPSSLGLKKETSVCPTRSSMNSIDDQQTDHVNVSVSESLSPNLDMNPYLI